MTITEQQLETWAAMAAAVTPGDLTTAETVISNNYFECPMCGGDGELPAELHENIDGRALSVAFFGIGPEFDAHHELWKASRTAVPLLVEEVRRMREALEKIAAEYKAHDAAGIDVMYDLARKALEPSS